MLQKQTNKQKPLDDQNRHIFQTRSLLPVDAQSNEVFLPKQDQPLYEFSVKVSLRFLLHN